MQQFVEEFGQCIVNFLINNVNVNEKQGYHTTIKIK